MSKTQPWILKTPCVMLPPLAAQQCLKSSCTLLEKTRESLALPFSLNLTLVSTHGQKSTMSHLMYSSVVPATHTKP